MSRRPVIVVIDDDPDAQQSLKEVWSDCDVRVSHPADVDDDVLAGGDLVLVDYYFEHWSMVTSGGSPVAQSPKNGLALAAVLRSHFAEVRRPVAFALRTERLEDLVGPWPNLPEQAIARLNNLEWVFPKASRAGHDPLQQIPALAHAVVRLPQQWPYLEYSATRAAVLEFFGIAANDASADSIWYDLESSRPPLHDLSERTAGVAFLRWFVQRALPYPGFLMDSFGVAARLRVSHEALEEALKSSNDALETARYAGPLSKFLGARWWRTIIERVAFEVSEGQLSDTERVLAGLRQRGLRLPDPSYQNPVVCIDASGRPAGLAEVEDSVRVQPDDWPVFADQPWARADDVRRDDRLRAIVKFEDRERLERNSK